MRTKSMSLVLLYGVACGGAALSQEPAWEPVPGSGFEGVPLHLIPIGGKMDKRAPARDVWAGLIAGMGKDTDTHKLLKRLLNSETVEVAVLPEKADVKFRPAAAPLKSSVYIALRFTPGRDRKDKFQGAIRGATNYMGFEVPPTRTWNDKADVFDAFVLAANEHLYRTKAGYHLHHGALPSSPEDLDRIDPGIRDPAMRGKYVAGEIKKYLDVYKK